MPRSTREKANTLLPEHKLNEDNPAGASSRQRRSNRGQRLISILFFTAVVAVIYWHRFCAPLSPVSSPNERAWGGKDAVCDGHDDSKNAENTAGLLGLPPDVLGFWAHGMQGKRMPTKEAEELYISIPNNDSAHARAVLLSSTPHRASTPGDHLTALHVLSHFQSALSVPVPRTPPIHPAGSPASRSSTLSASHFHRSGESTPSTWIDTYYPLMSEPLRGGQALELLSPAGEVIWSAPLDEPALPADPASEYARAVPPWHAYSANGTASGPLLYAGYGMPEDFAAALSAAAAAGRTTDGCIALVKYGMNFRGLKVRAAQDAGCAGVLIYSDTSGDGTALTPPYAPYPAGPARNPGMIQRGSVMFLSDYTGDPTTPGAPAYANATRLERARANIPRIPSLPLSWENGEKLREMGSAERVTVRIVNKVHERVMPIWNVMAVIPGHIADEVVMIGNHRDSWVLGAGDPTSGSAILHEMVEGFSALLDKGWKPLRTIMLASWDAEEYGMIGSTEWGEDFAPWVAEHVVAYLNMDGSGGSRFRVGASPSLAHVSRSAAESIPHPYDTNRTLWDARLDSGPFTAGLSDTLVDEEPRRRTQDSLHWLNEERATPGEITAPHHVETPANERPGKADDLGVEPLGAGTDFTVFLQHIGIASSDNGFVFSESDGVHPYHSAYDSLRWFETYADPGYHRHATIASYLGLKVLRISEAIVLPINTTQYAFELSDYLKRVEDIAAAGSFEFDFSDLRNAISDLQSASLALDKEKEEAEQELVEELKNHMGHHDTYTPSRSWIQSIFGIKSAMPDNYHIPEKLSKAVKRVRAVNKQLSSFERAFTSPAGLKNREWCRNLVVGPGRWLGYGATTFPGLTEALVIDKDPTLASFEAKRLREVIAKAAAGLKVASIPLD